MRQSESISRENRFTSSPEDDASATASDDNVSQYDAVLKLLQDVAIKMNESLTVEEALAFVLERICRFAHWPVGHALLLSRDGADELVSSGVFYLEDADAYEAFHRASLEISFLRGEGLPGYILRAADTAWISANDPRFVRSRAVGHLEVASGFGCPILTGDHVVGVLEFFSREDEKPDEEFVSVVSNIGAQLGRVIERQQASDAIRESEERLRALTEAAVEAIVTVDGRGTISDWSAGAEHTFGYLAEEAVGSPADLIIPERHLHADRRGIARYSALFRPDVIGQTIETEGKRADGSEIPVELSLTTWSARGDRFYTAIIRDISERRQADEAIRSSQERLRTREQQLERAQRIAHLGSWEWNVQTGELWWSNELYRMYGLDPEDEITYDRYIRLYHSDDRAYGESVVREALEAHEPFSFYHRIRRADTGEVRSLHGEGDVEIDSEGNAVKMIGTALDVTDLRRAEEDLRESERKFRLLAENMSDLILLQDRSGDLVYVSPSSVRILGYEADSLYGSNFYDLLEEEDAARLRNEAYGEMLDSEGHAEVIVQARTQDGTPVWLELTGKPIVDAEGSVQRLLASARDVTERIRAEEEAARYRSALERRNRELQDFAYVASHDLQEPLRKIRAFSDLIRDDYGDVLGTEGRGFLDRVQNAATRMSKLISDLLSFSRITTQGGSFEETDLNDVVEGVLGDLEIAIRESNADVHVDTLPSLEADPMQMRQLFQNLIGNAIKYRKPDEAPVIHLHAERIDLTPESGARSLKAWRIEVADNGIGFETRFADRIFTPFQRLRHKRKVQGTGMGLAICRRIIERHDGRISVESEPDVGTTFSVVLPLQQSTVNGT